MKKLQLFFAIIVIVSVSTWALKAQIKPKPQPPKSYTVSLTIEQWNNLLGGMEGVKNRLKMSDLPAKDVTYINDSLITIIQTEFVRQINTQVSAENKKDTTKPKKN